VNSSVCVDASLTLKLVLEEPDSDVAYALWVEWRAREVTAIAPTLWAYEVTSVLRNRVYLGKLPPGLEVELFEAVHQLPVRLMAPPGLHQRAAELARHFNRPAAYDSHYLALAEMRGCPFWTADERLFNALREELSWVHWLGNYPRPNR